MRGDVASDDGRAQGVGELATPVGGRLWPPTLRSCRPFFPFRTPHLKRQGRCELHVREAPEGEGEGFELAEDEREEGPALLSTVDRDISPSGTSPWTVIASSSRRNHPHQVADAAGSTVVSRGVRV